MSYTLKINVPDDTTPAQRERAEQVFRSTLESHLGDAALVAPAYAAYTRIVAVYGEIPGTDLLSSEEQLVFEQWQAAEAAAVQAVFGPHRHMGEGVVSIGLPTMGLP